MSTRSIKFDSNIIKMMELIMQKVLCEGLLVSSILSQKQRFYAKSEEIDSRQIEHLDYSQIVRSEKAPSTIVRGNEEEIFEQIDLACGEASIQRLVFVPLKTSQEKHLGNLIIFLKAGDPEPLLGLAENELELLANIMKECYDHSNLYFYENVFHISSEMVCVAGKDGFFKKINPAFRRTLLWSEADLLKTQCVDFIHPDDVKEVVELIKTVDWTTKSVDLKLRLKQKSGNYSTTEWVVTIDFSNGLLYGIGRDITKVEETKVELIRANGMLEKTNRVAKIGGWEFDVLTEELYWTSITKEIHDAEDDFIPNLSEGIGFYKEGESLNKITKVFNRALEFGEAFDVELEIITLMGNEKWVRSIGNPYFENGRCVKVTGTFQDISKDKKNRVALEAINTRMEAVLNASTETSIIATDLNGRITHFNSGSEILLGYTSKELVGIYTPIIFYDPKELEEQAKESSKEFGFTVNPGIDSFRLRSKLGLPDNGEFTYIRRDNERIDVKISVTPIKDSKEEIVGYLSVAVDITEKNLWEKKIIENEKRYRIFFDNSNVVMYTHTMNGDFMSINSIGAQLIGYSKEEIQRKNILDIVPIKAKENFPFYLKELHENGKSRGLMQVVNHSGKEITWMYNNVVAESVKGDEYVLGTVMDITDRIELERDLNESKKLAEYNAKMKDLFLANMSHEIRTPMNAITGFGRLLHDTKLDEEQKDYLKSINTASSNLLNIINDILDFSKIESGQINIESVEFDLLEQIANVERVLKRNVQEKELSFKVVLDANMPRFVLGDPTRLNQILTNLISNAIKFTESGFVKLEAFVTKVESDFQEIQFNVLDSGIGIPKDKIEVIFERFTQANTNTTRKYGGTGLGLSISKSLVELQNGTFIVESEEGVGSCFGFRIPFKKQIEQKIVKEEVKTSILKGSGLRVLLVEDNILNQKLAMKVLEKQGFNAKMACNGKLAIDILENETFDLILMDLQMPEMDGYQTTEYIRKEMKLEIPIIAMTAHSLVGEKEKCISIGMNDYLPKPFSQEQLYDKIITLTKERNVYMNEKTIKPTYDLNYLRTMAEGNKEFEKEIINTSLIHIPENLEQLLNAINQLDLKEISAVAHRLKSSFYVMGINDESLLKEFEKDGIEDRITLESMYSKLEAIYLETKKCLELELEEHYAEEIE